MSKIRSFEAMARRDPLGLRDGSGNREGPAGNRAPGIACARSGGPEGKDRRAAEADARIALSEGIPMGFTTQDDASGGPPPEMADGTDVSSPAAVEREHQAQADGANDEAVCTTDPCPVAHYRRPPEMTRARAVAVKRKSRGTAESRAWRVGSCRSQCADRDAVSPVTKLAVV
jgi:hypothetical protein